VRDLSPHPFDSRITIIRPAADSLLLTMLERSKSIVGEPQVAVALPKDDKIRYAVTECQRNLGSAIEELQRFRSLWFVANPPRFAEAREVILGLLDEAPRIRNSLLELKRITEPVSP
jgi:hypothetical protein